MTDSDLEDHPNEHPMRLTAILVVIPAVIFAAVMFLAALVMLPVAVYLDWVER